MPVRRCSDPTSVRHVWDAVRCTLHQRQQSDMGRLVRYLQRTCDLTTAQAESAVRQVQSDGLVHSVNRTGQKGAKLGVVTECFRVTAAPAVGAGAPQSSPLPEDDGHDWYCIECHLAGDVTCCATCHRVFHPACCPGGNAAVSTTSGGVPPQPECSVCRAIAEDTTPIADREELNRLLGFTLNRVKVWVPGNVTEGATPQPWLDAHELERRSRLLLYQTMDVPVMELKIRMKEYGRLAEFLADVQTIQHNVVVFHGGDSRQTQGSQLMLNDCRYDLTELRLCVDCYRHSNEKSSTGWFCIPCRPPHELVWAKQKGYPFWPAKVIRAAEEQCDVRFFGTKHLRALVDRANIRPIETNVQYLQVKRTQAFNRALQELALHQSLLRDPSEVTRMLADADRKADKRAATMQRRNKVPGRPGDVYEFSDSPSGDGPIGEHFHESPATSDDKAGLADMKEMGPADAGCRVIDVSDGDSKPIDHDHVSSSTENVCPVQSHDVPTSSAASADLQPQEKPNIASVEKMRRQLEQIEDRDELMKTALDLMQQELDRCQSVYTEEMRSVADAHTVLVSEIKKKQWCYNCEQEAIYHCCWNTAYCSTACQQQHWQSEHKKVCRRKR